MSGSADDEDRDGTGLSPDEAFSLLGNETRITILRALWEADDPYEGPSTVAFSELYRRVGATDSGQFNYHLGKLAGSFVRQTDAGYELREAGYQVIRAVLAGAINEDPSFGPAAIDAKCPFCGSVVEMRYESDRLTARCTDCVGVIADGYPTGTFLSFGFPPAGLDDRTPEDVLASAHTLYDSKITPMLDGVCPECAGKTSVSIEICDEHDTAEGICPECGSAYEIWATYVCEHCKYARKCLVWFKLVNQPVVIAFYYRHGNIRQSVPFRKLTWESRPYVAGITEEVIAEDPLRIRVTIPFEGHELRVTVDEKLEIVEATEASPH